VKRVFAVEAMIIPRWTYLAIYHDKSPSDDDGAVAG
jgi:hypothetical protein